MADSSDDVDDVGRTVELDVLPRAVTVCQLDADDPLPDWVDLGDRHLVSVTRTKTELSIVTQQDDVPLGVVAERGWRVLAVRGPLAFSLTGVLAGLADPLAQAGIPIFVLSTYDTDLVLVRDEALTDAVEALRGAGHVVHGAD